MQDKMQDKKKKWDEWEMEVEREERLRKEQQQTSKVKNQKHTDNRILVVLTLFISLSMTQTNIQGGPRTRQTQIQRTDQSTIQPYLQAFQQSEEARSTRESQLDDIQRRLQDRVRQRQQRSDRWMPSQYTDVVARRAAEEQARAAAAAAAMRERRRLADEERVFQKGADAAAASQFLQGRVRQKASRFADLVDSMQSMNQEERIDPYQRRQEEQRRQSVESPMRQQQQSQVEIYYEDDNMSASSYLHPDVIRVSRGRPEEQQQQVDGIWVAGSSSSSRSSNISAYGSATMRTDVGNGQSAFEGEEKEEDDGAVSWDIDIEAVVENRQQVIDDDDDGWNSTAFDSAPLYSAASVAETGEVGEAEERAENDGGGYIDW